jgi:hypothetical protein
VMVPPMPLLLVEMSRSPLEADRAHLLCALEQTSARALSASHHRFGLSCTRAGVLEGVK